MRRGDPRLPAASEIKTYGIADWAQRLISRLNDRLIAIDNDVWRNPVRNWTPAITFVTPGNLSVAYSTQIGKYVINGNVVQIFFQIATSTFTHSTASGNLRITGLPVNSDGNMNYSSAVRFQGITKASYSEAFVSINTTTVDAMQVAMDGSGVSDVIITASDMPTAGSVILIGQLSYFKATT